MSWLDKHRRKLLVQGSTIAEEQENSTVNFVNANFKDSPSYKIVLIDGVETEVRIVTDRDYQEANEYNIKKLLLRPYAKIERGQYVQFNDENWLILFFQNDKIYPNAHIRFCNNILKFPNGNEYPCVIDNKLPRLQTVDERRTIVLPSDVLTVTIKANEDTKNIEKLQRFIVDDNAWEVQVLDRVSNLYNGVGVVQFIMKQVPLKDEEVETPTITPPIPTVDYHVEIVGVEEVEIKKTALFVGNVYLNGMLTNETVVWEVDKGAVNTLGFFTAPIKTGQVKIVAKYSYRNITDIMVTKIAEKEVTIFDNNDWSW